MFKNAHKHWRRDFQLGAEKKVKRIDRRGREVRMWEWWLTYFSKAHDERHSHLYSTLSSVSQHSAAAQQHSASPALGRNSRQRQHRLDSLFLSSRVGDLEKLSFSRAITLLKFRDSFDFRYNNNYNNSSNIIMTTGSHRTIHVYRVCS